MVERSRRLGQYHGEGSRYPRSTGAEIAGISLHGVRGTVVGHGGVDLAAGWIGSLRRSNQRRRRSGWATKWDDLPGWGTDSRNGALW